MGGVSDLFLNRVVYPLLADCGEKEWIVQYWGWIIFPHQSRVCNIAVHRWCVILHWCWHLVNDIAPSQKQLLQSSCWNIAFTRCIKKIPPPLLLWSLADNSFTSERHLFYIFFICKTLMWVTICKFPSYLCHGKISFVAMCTATADGFASTVMSPELRTALHEGWSYAKNGIQSIAAYLHIFGEHPQPESE